ncbi:hypothetical protein CHU98_g4632 [Xylaria longipes]|nr:hypothetical protein CHU98_g4632 [Xylaria longipes]
MELIRLYQGTDDCCLCRLFCSEPTGRLDGGDSGEDHCKYVSMDADEIDIRLSQGFYVVPAKSIEIEYALPTRRTRGRTRGFRFRLPLEAHREIQDLGSAITHDLTARVN